MTIPIKKLKNGFELPVLGLGTSQMHGIFSDDVDSIKAALKLGYTHIDTAEVYSDGLAEKKVGEAIKDFDRPKLFITTKVTASHFGYDDLIKACHDSLDRLQTDYIDLYLLHHPGFETPIKETMAALDYLLEQGLIKNIGVSNFTPDQVRQAAEHTQNLIVNNQIHYSLLSQEPDNVAALKYAQENDMLITAYRPLERGSLLDPTPEIKKLCEKYNKTPAQIAINWLISQAKVVAIVKASNIDHLKENLGALGWEMTKAEIENLFIDKSQV